MIAYRPPNRPYYGNCIDDLLEDYCDTEYLFKSYGMFKKDLKEMEKELNKRGLEIFNNQGLFLIELEDSKKLKVVSYE